MSLRFTSQLMIDNLPDEQTTDQFEVIMPELPLLLNDKKFTPSDNKKSGNVLDSVGGFLYKYRPIVEEITFGHMNFTTDTRRVRTGWYNVPKDIENYHDVKIAMFCSNGMTTQYYLESWKKLIYNPRGEYFYPGRNYKKNIDVFIYGAGGSGALGSIIPKAHYTLMGCFPYLQEDYRFEYTDNPQRFRISATFKVDKVKRDESSTRASVITEMVSSPTSILDKGLASLSSSSTYDINEVYGGGNSLSKLGKLI